MSEKEDSNSNDEIASSFIFFSFQMFRAVSQYTAIRSISYTIPQCKVYDFTGDQIWWSIRKPGLDTSKQAGGRRTILIPREDFWEGTVYGHGGEAKLFQGLKNDQVCHLLKKFL